MPPTSQSSLPTPAQTPRSAAPSNERFYLLDGLRGILALFVVYRHCPDFLASTINSANFFLAVDFFFCLSGFVIAFAYEDRLRTRLNLRDFIVARLIRFYPMFLIGTLFAFLSALGPEHLLSAPGGLGHVLGSLPSLLFLPAAVAGSHRALYPLNTPSWTLLTELIANLGFGLLIRRKLPLRAVLSLVLLVSGAELVLTARPFDSGSTWPGFAVGMARMGFSFSLGVFVFHFWRRLPLGGLRRQRGLLSAAVIVVLLLGSLVLHTSFTQLHAYQLAIMTFLMPSLIFFGADVKLGATLNKSCAILGDMSYPLYIIHVPLLSPLFGGHIARFAQGSPAIQRFFVPLCDVVLATFAWLLETFLNAPLRRSLTTAWRRRTQPARPFATYPPQPLTPEPTPAQ